VNITLIRFLYEVYKTFDEKKKKQLNTNSTAYLKSSNNILAYFKKKKKNIYSVTVLTLIDFNPVSLEEPKLSDVQYTNLCLISAV